MSRLLAAACVAAFMAGAGPAVARAEAMAPAPETRAPLSTEEAAALGAVFGVVQMNDLAGVSENWSVRMYGIAGSDPAANGLMTYLAFVTPHADQGFLIGNFRDYRVLAATPGRIDLEIDEDVMGENGELSLVTRRVTVTWTEAAQEASPEPVFPANVTITPAP